MKSDLIPLGAFVPKTSNTIRFPNGCMLLIEEEFVNATTRAEHDAGYARPILSFKRIYLLAEIDGFTHRYEVVFGDKGPGIIVTVDYKD